MFEFCQYDVISVTAFGNPGFRSANDPGESYLLDDLRVAPQRRDHDDRLSPRLLLRTIARHTLVQSWGRDHVDVLLDKHLPANAP